MGDNHTGPKLSLGGADSETYFYLHMVPLGYQIKGECDCGYIAQYNQAFSGHVVLVNLGWLPTYERGILIINLRQERLISLR